MRVDEFKVKMPGENDHFNSTGNHRNGEGVGRVASGKYEQEEDSDVRFIVGHELDTWRIPGHRNILSQVNPVFRAMFQGPLASGPTVRIRDVDPRAFDHLLRFLYKQNVKLTSASTALLTLYAAHKYLCGELVKKCIVYLDENLDVSNVLQVYQHLRIYTSSGSDEILRMKLKGAVPGGGCVSAQEASAPPLPLTPLNTSPSPSPLSLSLNNKNPTQFTFPQNPTSHTNTNTNTNANGNGLDGSLSTSRDSLNDFSEIDYYCCSLLFNCLVYIDGMAEEILNEESLENLSDVELKEILERDSLRVSSELAVFNALNRWCNMECKKLHLELTKENRCKILSDQLLFTCRYLLMTSEEFLQGPMESNLLEKPEETLLLSLIINNSNSNSSNYNCFNIFKKQTCSRLSVEVLKKISWKRARKLDWNWSVETCPCLEPVPLSDRSKAIAYSLTSAQNYHHSKIQYQIDTVTPTPTPMPLPPPLNLKENKVKKDKDKNRNKKKKRKSKEINREEKRCCSSRITDCMLRALVCIFD